MPRYLLVEKNKWNDVSRDLHQAGQEEYQINVGVELRHVEGETEVESSQGKPTETHHYRIPSYHRCLEQIQKCCLFLTFFFQFWYSDVALDAVDLHNLLDGVPTLILPGGGEQPFRRLRHEEEERGEGKNSQSNKYL